MRGAVAQIEPKLGEKERNLEVCLTRLEEAAAAGAELLVLPECAIPGYMFDSAEEAIQFAEEIPAPRLTPWRRRAAASGPTSFAVCSNATAICFTTSLCSSARTASSATTGRPICRSRDKNYEIPGEYELYLFGDRRPDLYGALVEEMEPVKT
jgi:hypothetical protein